MNDTSVSATKKPTDTTTTWVCTVCGYVHTGSEPPANCPKCGAPKEKFKKQ